MTEQECIDLDYRQITADDGEVIYFPKNKCFGEVRKRFPIFFQEEVGYLHFPGLFSILYYVEFYIKKYKVCFGKAFLIDSKPASYYDVFPSYYNNINYYDNILFPKQIYRRSQILDEVFSYSHSCFDTDIAQPFIREFYQSYLSNPCPFKSEYKSYSRGLGGCSYTYYYYCYYISEPFYLYFYYLNPQLFVTNYTYT